MITSLATPVRMAGLAAATLLLAACGGGSGGSQDFAGISGTGFTEGRATGFGSVFVNGAEYQIPNDASVEVDDDPGTEDDLEVGMVLRIRSRIAASGERSAERVEYDPELEGPVSAVDTAAGTLTVLGRTVQTDGATVFDTANGELADITSDDFVEVSGFRDAAGVIHASFVENKQADEAEIKGVVSNLDGMAKTFDIGSLTVDYNDATLSDFPAGGIADGQLVEVKGSLSAGTLDATEVEHEDAAPELDEDTETEVEGIVSGFADNGGGTVSFTLAGLTVEVDSGASFEGGALGDIADGVQLEAEGVIDAQGRLQADEIEFEEVANARLQDTVDSVDSAAGTFTLLGGVVVEVTDTTRLKDDSSMDLRDFSFSDLAANDAVEVDGADVSGQDRVIAAKVVRDDSISRRIVQGEVDSKDASSNRLVILGVTVNTSGASFQKDTSFSSISVGDIVKAKGQESTPGVIDADEVEIED